MKNKKNKVLKNLIAKKKQEHLALLDELDQLTIINETPCKHTTPCQKQQTLPILKEFSVSPKWLMGLKPSMAYECDILFQEELDIDSIVKHQLRERIQKQKELQKKQYQELLQELNLEEKHQQFDQRVQEDFQCTYQYQSQGKIVSIDIKYYDFLKLNPNNYVNDTIINFFLRFIENDLFKNLSVLIYNTYFCAKLLNFQQDTKQLYQHYLQNNNILLQKWTKEDIFVKEYLIFPLHLREHWAVIIVVKPLAICKKLCNIPEEQQGYLLYFDSLLQVDPRIGLLLKFYLLHVFNSTQKMQYTNEYIFQQATSNKIQVHQPVVPRQTNLVDCGLYMLEYVERFLQKPEVILNFLNDDHLTWFPKVAIFIKRILIKKTLQYISTGIKDSAQRYLQTRQQIDDQEPFKKPIQYDFLDESLFEQLQISRLEFHLSEDYNYYNEGNN